MQIAMREPAKKSLKTQLILDEIAKAENIAASDEDVNAEVEKMAEMYGVDKDVILEDVKKSGNYARFVENTKYQIVNRKTVDFLVKEAK